MNTAGNEYTATQGTVWTTISSVGSMIEGEISIELPEPSSHSQSCCNYLEHLHSTHLPTLTPTLSPSPNFIPHSYTRGPTWINIIHCVVLYRQRTLQSYRVIVSIYNDLYAYEWITHPSSLAVARRGEEENWTKSNRHPTRSNQMSLTDHHE